MIVEGLEERMCSAWERKQSASASAQSSAADARLVAVRTLASVA